ncbi:Diphthamide biosynthesis protein 3 [Rhynchospora pubera]|uniref:Diphthamide biosynthesis protein 3 n=1 Tax=Rhynchospora pubera TaxID=906938 RepID=A0AAV8CQW1_9POAL|nr:Diphthamide biosynthesis protein 3 [Rhynchospora pubera]
MSYDDVEIEDMEWRDDLKAYTYPCPCGDLFQITLDDLRLGEEIARCPSCSLYITVVYNPEDFSPSKDPPTSNKPNPQPIALSFIFVAADGRTVLELTILLNLEGVLDVIAFYHIHIILGFVRFFITCEAFMSYKIGQKILHVLSFHPSGELCHLLSKAWFSQVLVTLSIDVGCTV